MRLNWFLRSVLMEESGTGEGGEGGGGDSTALTVSGGTDVATIDGTRDEGTGDGALATTTAADSEPVFEGGKLSPSASKTFRQLRTTNPTLRNVIDRSERALGTVAKLTAMFGPKPFDRINQLRKMEREVGGAAGLQALREANDDLIKSDQLYERADPQLISMMTESPAGKQAFVKIFPHSVQRMRELAPQTYTKWVGQQFLHSLEKLEVTLKKSDGAAISTEPIDMPFRLRRIFGQLPPTDEHGRFVGGAMTADQEQAIYSDLANIYAWVEKIRSWANATPEDLTPPKEDTSAAAIAKAQKDADAATEALWAEKRDVRSNKIIDDEVSKQTKGMDLSSTLTADIAARARKSINDARKVKPDNSRKIRSFFESKDMIGYLDYNIGIVQDNVQSAVEKATALYAKKSTRRAGAPATTAATTTTTEAAQTQPVQTGKVTRLTAQQSEAIGGKYSTRWMKQALAPGLPGTTGAMHKLGQQMLRKGNPLGLPDGTVVQFP